MLKLVVQKEFKKLENKLQYVIDNFNTVYEMISDFTIHYGEFSDINGIGIKPGSDVLEFFQFDKETPNEYFLLNYKRTKIPILFNSSSDDELLTYNQNNVRINFDILLSAFYFLSSWQEWHSKEVDKYGRFPAESHLLYKLDCLKIPVVNYYFDILADAIKEIDKKSIQLKNSTFKTIISHDIDECTTGWLYNSFWYLKDFKILKSFQMIFQKIFRNDIWFNFDKIIEVEKKHEIKSSYFFIPTNKKYGKIKNSDYKFHSKPMQDAVNKLESNGHEIAIHGSYGTGFINGMMEEELSQFGRETKGGRFHYLAIKIPDSFDIIEKSGIKYDSSLGFAQSVGFRTGYCYPYFPYDITNNRKYTFLEFPLSIMDITLENKQYMNCKLNNATNIINPIINEVEKFGGVLTILWHNKFFSGYKYGWGQTFEVVVEYCKSKHTQFHLFKNFIK